MGTRNLTIVVLDGKYKVAQYCQWDGYPKGVGYDIMHFLHKQMQPLKFREALKKCKFVKDDYVDSLWKKFGSIDGLVTVEQGDLFKVQYPQFYRDTGPDILKLIQDSGGFDLQNSIDCVGQGWIEWVYVIDLDNKILEIYNSYKIIPLTKEDRFFGMKGKPPRLVIKIPFNKITKRLLGLVQEDKIPPTSVEVILELDKSN